MILTAAAVLAGIMIAGLLVWRFRPRSPEPSSPAAPLETRPVASSQPKPQESASELAITPFFYLTGDPPGPQQVVLEANKPFRLVYLDYLTGSGKSVARQELNLEGYQVTHPIADQFIRSVLRLESNPWDGSGVIQMRFHLQAGTRERDVLFVVSIVPEMKLGDAGRMTEHRRLVDPRTLPASMESSLVQ
ncbi:MAG TPA: hypothetical protein VGL89_04775 [Candidatus Koribacter sp.]